MSEIQKNNQHARKLNKDKHTPEEIKFFKMYGIYPKSNNLKEVKNWRDNERKGKIYGNYSLK